MNTRVLIIGGFLILLGIGIYFYEWETTERILLNPPNHFPGELDEPYYGEWTPEYGYITKTHHLPLIYNVIVLSIGFSLTTISFFLKSKHYEVTKS